MLRQLLSALTEKMILDSHNSDAMRRIVNDSSIVKGLLDKVTAFTLPGISEVLVSAMALGSGSALTKEIERYCKKFQKSALQAALVSWRLANSAAIGKDMHGIRSLEFYRLRFREDQTNLPYQLYQERFVRSLQESGSFPKQFAKALAGALAEMSDNIVQHSAADSSTELTGLIGYHIKAGFMCFAVIDIGQGVLRSLARSPNWRHLEAPAQALKAAVCDFATSRVGEPHGDGFRTLFRAMVDRNCCLRFRSDNAVLTVHDARSHREGVVATSPFLQGLQLSVCCALRGKAGEEPI